MRWLPLALVLACTNAPEKAIEADVKVIATREDALSIGAVDRVVARGVRAIPELETARPSAGVPGRLNCVTALRRIGRIEAVPILRQVAAHDLDERVRAEAALSLTEWAKTDDDRGKAARAALRRVSELRGESAPG
jgi:hypothetical protein